MTVGRNPPQARWVDSLYSIFQELIGHLLKYLNYGISGIPKASSYRVSYCPKK